MRKRFSLLCVFLLSVLLITVLTSCELECPHLRMSKQLFEPDCSSEGYTRNTCPDCGYEYLSDFVAPLGHVRTATIKNPTCADEGYTEYICTREGANCDYHYTTDLVAPLGHAYQVKATTEPDCSIGGCTEYECKRCQETYTGDYCAPLGHDFISETVGPTTCTLTGLTTYTCQRCTHSYIGDFVFYSDVFDGAYSSSTEPLAHGVDVSKYQHELDEDGNYLPLDFEAIRAAGFEFVILKAGSTPRINASGAAVGGIEPTFEADYAAARAAGLDIGVYFYTYSLTVEDTKRDAELLMTWLEDKQLEYPVYFDVEHSTIAELERTQITDLCLAFISTLQAERYYGALYTNNNWLMNHLQTDKVTFLFDIWYARYPITDGPFIWNTEKYGNHMGMWQYTQTGKIEGISDAISFDFDYAYKDYPSIIRAMGYNNFDAEE